MSTNQALEQSPEMISAESRPTNVFNSREVLEKVFELLEEFGPVWYTEDLHDRVVEALQNK